MRKQDRIAVHQKYGERCAYCGRKLAYKDMQVDHIVPKRLGGRDVMKNYNPSCRSCNHYKRAYTLEAYRDLMKTLHLRLNKIYIVKVAINYGILKVKPFDGTFYFERFRKRSER